LGWPGGGFGGALRDRELRVCWVRMEGGHRCSGKVGRSSKEIGVSPVGQGRRTGEGKDHPGGCRVHPKAVDWECQRPQAQMLLRGAPLTVRAAAPMRRRLCHVKELQVELAKRQWKEC